MSGELTIPTKFKKILRKTLEKHSEANFMTIGEKCSLIDIWKVVGKQFVKTFTKTDDDKMNTAISNYLMKNYFAKIEFEGIDENICSSARIAVEIYENVGEYEATEFLTGYLMALIFEEYRNNKPITE